MMPSPFRLATALLLLLSLSAGTALGQDPSERKGSRKKPDGEKKSSVQPYDEVIPEDARTLVGLFRVHRVGDQVLYEIPPDSLGRELLWVTQIEETQAGFGYGGTPVGNRVVRWELRDESVLLRDVKYRIRADVDDTVRNAVEATSLEPIIQVFPVKAWGKDKAPVIDVSEIFTGDLTEFSPKRRLNASGIDKKRTFVESVKAFPRNIETEVLATYKLSSGGSERGRAPVPSPRRRGPRRDPTQGAVTVLLHHSMVALPEEPMPPREHDDRVGYFTVSFEDYGSDEHAVETKRYITRWRLEKKDPAAAVSDPVQPIVFYVGRGVPQKWRPFVRKGIESWQPAFEAAGFSNAILAKDAPTRREDPQWDAEDARYSSIRWLPSTVENAMGPHVHDPRTGEILEADILMYHNVLKLCRDWYFTQCGAVDERARTLPLPDDLLGELLAYVVAHEVGHSLGFPHNMKASSSYTVAQLRDPEFTRKYGTEASIMDYGRFNYVAQPGDGAALIPVVGPYDHFAVEWGYRQYESRQAEEEGLAALISRQIEDPMLRFGNPNPAEDPTQQTEDLGSDPIASTALGLKNIDRIADRLVEACCREGEDYALLENMYDRLLRQRDRELGHVANVVGGVVRTNLWYGQRDRVYDPVEVARQREAVAFLVDHSFQTPGHLVTPELTRRLEASGAADRVLRGQRSILRTLMSDSRIRRMAELATHDERAYAPAEMLETVRRGIWSEVTSGAAIDLYRRNLQRAHVEMLGEEVKGERVDSDLPALARGELEAILRVTYDYVTQGSQDVDSQRHVADVRARIIKALDPKAAPATEAPTSSVQSF